MKYISLFETFVKVSDEEMLKANKTADKVETWLKSIHVDYKKDISASFTKYPQFYIYQNLGGCWTFEYDEIRTKKKTNKSSGFYGDYHETGKMGWHMTWPNKSILTLSDKRKRTNFSTFKQTFERALLIEKYFENVIEFLKCIGEETEMKRNSIMYTVQAKNNLSSQYNLPKFNLEIRSSENKTVEQSFGIWWRPRVKSNSIFSADFKYVDPTTCELLILVNKIVENDNKNLSEFLERNKNQPVEKILPEVKEMMKGRIAAKKFLG